MSQTVKQFIRYLVATPQRRDDRLNIRRWYVFYVLYLIGVCLVCQWGYSTYARGNAEWAKAVWFLGLYLFYFSLACTYIPLPTVWLALLLASPAGGLTVLGPWWRVLAVAGVGALATGVSHLHEYYLVTYLLRLGRIHRIKQTRIYLWAEKKFKLWPFTLQVLFNIFPVPADPSRWIAIMSGYSRSRFFLAQASGRFVRYAFLALAAESLKMTVLQVILISALLVAGSAAFVTVQRIRTRRVQEIE